MLNEDSQHNLIFQYLNLGNNGLSELPGELFKELRNLLEIDLSKNEFKQVPDVLANLISLEVLVLDSNPIYELTDGTFSGKKKTCLEYKTRLFIRGLTHDQ